MVGNRRSGRVGAGLFGWIHSSGVGELADTGPGRLTGARYVEILDDILLESVRILLFPEGVPFYLVQDNSPIHTSRVVRDWFQRHPEITLLPHPPRSPDLNPIEHVWAAMTRRMRANPACHSSDEVIADARQAWEEIRSPAGQELTVTLVGSLPSRLNSVIGAGGAYTHY